MNHYIEEFRLPESSNPSFFSCFVHETDYTENENTVQVDAGQPKNLFRVIQKVATYAQTFSAL